MFLKSIMLWFSHSLGYPLCLAWAQSFFLRDKLLLISLLIVLRWISNKTYCNPPKLCSLHLIWLYKKASRFALPGVFCVCGKTTPYLRMTVCHICKVLWRRQNYCLLLEKGSATLCNKENPSTRSSSWARLPWNTRVFKACTVWRPAREVCGQTLVFQDGVQRRRCGCFPLLLPEAVLQQVGSSVWINFYLPPMHSLDATSAPMLENRKKCWNTWG